MFRVLLRLMRPSHWTKNLVCLAGVLFSKRADEPVSIGLALLTVAAFCLASSSAYILNDLYDREADRAHPIKRNRPVASGAVSSPVAMMTAGICLALALGIALWIEPAVALLILIYAAMHVGYSAWWKRVVILDVMIISAGFLLRILAGTAAVGVPASAWILLCAFFLSLFLGFAKRRAELNVQPNGPILTRHVLVEYSVAMLDRFCNICATLALSSYALFTVMSRPEHSLIVTCPPVAFGLLRYVFLIEGRGEGETPEIVLLKDRPIQIAIGLWLFLYIVVLYGGVKLIAL